MRPCGVRGGSARRPPAVEPQSSKAPTEAVEADAAAATHRRRCPRHPRIAVANIEPAQRQCPLSIGQMPERGCLVLAEKVKEDALRLHLH